MAAEQRPQGYPTDGWLDACRRMVAAQGELFARDARDRGPHRVRGRRRGRRPLAGDRPPGRGASSSPSSSRCTRTGASSRRSPRSAARSVFGDGSAPARVVIDPIDGSLNARRTLPSFALSIAVASGASMADVEFGFVYDFGAGEEFVAARGAGATLERRGAARAAGPGYGLEVVGPRGGQARADPAGGRRAAGQGVPDPRRSARSRSPSATWPRGASTACSPAARCRSVDVAGGAADRPRGRREPQVRRAASSTASHLDLEARFPIAAALDEEMLGTLLEVQREAAPAPRLMSGRRRLGAGRARRRGRRSRAAGRGAASGPRPTRRGEVERACAEAIGPVCEYAGLGAGRPIRRRPSWSTAASGRGTRSRRSRERGGAARGAGSPTSSRCPGRSGRSPAGPPAPRSAPRPGSPPATRRAGSSASTTSRSSARRARRACCSSAENLAAARRRSSTPIRELFLRWVALHETTHVGPVRARRLAARPPARPRRRSCWTAPRGASTRARSGDARRGGSLRDPRELVRALLRGELARLLADPRAGARRSTACRRRCR